MLLFDKVTFYDISANEKEELELQELGNVSETSSRRNTSEMHSALDASFDVHNSSFMSVKSRTEAVSQNFNFSLINLKS